MSARTGSRRRAWLEATAVTVALGAAAAAVERRHLRRLAGDEEYAQLRRPRPHQDLRVVSADGTALHAEVFGASDSPTIVLAHGWTEQVAFWGPVIDHLPELRIVAYDLRGHGRSDTAVDRDYSLDRFGEDVEAVVRAAADATPGPVIVAGHSLGAMSIAAWAEHHDPAARAAGAALINTGLGDLATAHLLLGGEVAKLLNHPWLSRRFLGSRLPVPPFSTPVDQAVIRYAAFGPEAGRAEVAFYERMLIECAADVRAAVGIALSDMNLWEAVSRLTIPTLVIAGDRDRLTPPAHAQRIARDLPSPAGLIELRDTGHMSPLERPREVAEALTELLRSVTATSGAATPGVQHVTP